MLNSDVWKVGPVCFVPKECDCYSHIPFDKLAPAATRGTS